MNTTTLHNAKILWSYLSAHNYVEASDAIVVCCSYDLRVCDYACQLIQQGYSEQLVISGKHGNWTKHLWDVPEADIFTGRAVSNGIDKDRIIIETEAANFGENITFSRALLPEANSVIFVSKPNSLLRVKLTAEAQWPEVNAFVSSPNIKFPDDVSNIIGVWGVISEMVGDIERILKYPAMGFQASHNIPGEIMDAWRYLVQQGFTHHLLPED